MATLPKHSAPRQGLALIYIALTIPVMVAMASLAVDYGRLMVAKSQLSGATDAAVLAAVSQLSPGSNSSSNFSQATTAANAMLANNTVDIVKASNATTTVSYGTWSSETFTAGNTSASNAARIVTKYPVPTMWASILGSQTSTVTGTSTAVITPATPGYGVVGIGGMNLNTAVVVDSYTPTSGTYAATHAQQAGVASGGSWNINSGFTVKGNLYYASGGSAPSGGSVTGTRTALPASPSLASLFPAASTPGGATQCGNYNGGNLTLAAGTYYYTSFNLNSSDTLTISGLVNIYVNGNINLNGNVNVGGLPSNCQIYNVSGSGINIGGSGSIYAELYGPNSPCNFNTSGDLYGSIISSQISTGGSGRIHCDASATSSGGGITLVK